MITVNEQYWPELQISKGIQLQQLETSKYLGMAVNKDGFGDKEIEIRIQQSQKLVECLNYFFWD
jgi:hypothetical protein